MSILHSCLSKLFKMYELRYYSILAYPNFMNRDVYLNDIAYYIMSILHICLSRTIQIVCDEIL